MSWQKQTHLICDRCGDVTHPMPDAVTVVEDLYCENVNLGRSKDEEKDGNWHKAGSGEHYCPNCKEEVKNLEEAK